MSDTLSFSQLPLNDDLLKNLISLGFETTTPIQQQSLPHLLKGEDVIAKAKTGSGKTAAFGLTLLNGLNLKFFAVQALVLCPTRELAEQVSQAIRQLARLMPNVKIINLSGGLPMKPQLDSLRHGAHVIVGTPGRIQKHLDKESLVLDKVNVLVLDEADRMLDMGFLDAIRSVVKTCPKKRQTLLFSATYPAEIKQLSFEFMQNPKEIFVESEETTQDIEQQFYEINTNISDKYSVLTTLLNQYHAKSALIFCNTKQTTADIAAFLKRDGFSVIALHGDMEQPDRDLSIIQLINQSCSILVATDVAARGIDIKDLPLVINYELAHDSDVHTHRIGRTGRAGKKGVAISLVSAADVHRVRAIEKTTGQSIHMMQCPECMKNTASLYGSEMATICLDSGKKDKIRAGDILGALTKDAGLPNHAIGKIDVFLLKSYVAIHKDHVKQALKHIQTGMVKGRRVNVRLI